MQFDADLKSDHKDLFLSAREYLLSFAGMLEIRKERITTYAYKSPDASSVRNRAAGNICHMRTMPYGIDLGLLKGARMKDDLGLLQGAGKAMRVLPLHQLNKDVIRYYIDQAILINNNRKNDN